MRVTRKQLYKEVWKTPATVLAKKYGISDRGLGKICTRLNIPKPTKGHWQKIKAGKQIEAPPLPASTKEIPSFVEINKSLPKEKIEKIKALSPILDITVPKKISKPHALIKATKLYFIEREKPNFWSTHNENKLYLDINVTKRLQPRALRIMDTIIKAIETRGHTVLLINEYERETVAVIDNEKIPFAIFEKSTKQVAENKDEYAPVEYKKTGKLSLLCKSYAPNFRKSWNDGKRQEIEHYIGDFILNLEAIAEYEVERTKQREEDHKRWAAERLAREEENERIEKLNHEVSLYLKIKNIEEYLNHYKINKINKCENWIGWVDSYIQSLYLESQV